MNAMKKVIIGLAVALVVAIGYTVYLHQGPIKSNSNENRNLLAEIDQLKTASKDMNTDHKALQDAKTRRVQELETKNVALEETVARVSEEKELIETELEKLVSQKRKAKESVEANLQSKVGSLENQLV